jgi:hypothetical protein
LHKGNAKLLRSAKKMGEPEQQQHVLTTLSKKQITRAISWDDPNFLIVHPTRTQARGVEVSAVSLHYDAKFNLVALFDHFDFLNKDRRCV